MVVDDLRALRVGPGSLLSGTPDAPLAGLEFVAKDVFDVAGHRTGAGNPTWLAQAEPAARSAAAVERLRAAGASCIGKSHTDEFAFSLAGRNAHYGLPHNAAAPGCATGGSSSGSAAAVAGGLVPFALGTDTGGSIRVPASYCGLVGVRPTHGVVSVEGMVALAPSFDTVGWLAAGVTTARRVAEVLLPADTGRPAQRLALLSDLQSAVPAPIAATARRAAEELARRTGLPLTTLTLPGPPLEEWLATFRTIQTFEAHRTHGAWVTANAAAVSPDVRERFASGGRVSPRAFQEATALRSTMTTGLLALLGDPATVLVLPSAAGTATPVSAPEEALAEIRTSTLRLTCIAGIAGVPAVSVPLATVDGLPFGIGLLGLPGAERSLLELAELGLADN